VALHFFRPLGFAFLWLCTFIVPSGRLCTFIAPSANIGLCTFIAPSANIDAAVHLLPEGAGNRIPSLTDGGSDAEPPPEPPRGARFK
jgi:hypothetical protein